VGRLGEKPPSSPDSLDNDHHGQEEGGEDSGMFDSGLNKEQVQSSHATAT
jgi:hypothetical protein